jgi:hypothetical protein
MSSSWQSGIQSQYRLVLDMIRQDSTTAGTVTSCMHHKHSAYQDERAKLSAWWLGSWSTVLMLDPPHETKTQPPR